MRKPYDSSLKPINSIDKQSPLNTQPLRHDQTPKKEVLPKSDGVAPCIWPGPGRSNLITYSENRAKRRKIDANNNLKTSGDEVTYEGSRKCYRAHSRISGAASPPRKKESSFSSPIRDFTTSGADEFLRVEERTNPKENTRLSLKKLSKDPKFSPHLIVKPSPSKQKSRAGSEDAQICLADEPHSVVNTDISINTNCSIRHNLSRSNTSKNLDLPQIVDNTDTARAGNVNKMSTRSPLLLASLVDGLSKNSSVARMPSSSARRGTSHKKHINSNISSRRQSADELSGNCNIGSTLSIRKALLPDSRYAGSNYTRAQYRIDGAYLIDDDPLKKDPKSNTVNKSAKYANRGWPLKLYRTDLDDSYDCFLILDKIKSQFVVEKNIEARILASSLELIDKKKIHKLTYSRQGDKLIMYGPKRAECPSVYAFQFSQNADLTEAIHALKAARFYGDDDLRERTLSDVEKIFERVALDRSKRSIRLSDATDNHHSRSFNKSEKSSARSYESDPSFTIERKRHSNEVDEVLKNKVRVWPQRQSSRKSKSEHHVQEAVSALESTSPIHESPFTQKWSELHLPVPWPEPIVYPLVGNNRTTVQFEDLFRLDDGEFLNDNIISFYIRYISERSKISTNKVYFFNTYFFSRLTSGDSKPINYAAVQKWTSKVDIFEYDYLIVPVNHALHWYLIIICNPTALKKVRMTSKSTLPGVGAQREILFAEEELSIPDNVPPIGNEKKTSGLGSDFHRLVLSERMPKSPEICRELRTRANSNNKDYDSVNNNETSPYFNPLAGNTIPKIELNARNDNWEEQTSLLSPKEGHDVKDTLPSDNPVMTIFTLDSFGESRTQAIRILKSYLIEEAKTKHGVEVNKKSLQGITAKGIPLQPNGCDCGVYLLGYVEKFMQQPDEFVKKLRTRSMSMAADWSNMNAKQIRSDIRERILEVQIDQEVTRQEQLATKRYSKKRKHTKVLEKNNEAVSHRNLTYVPAKNEAGPHPSPFEIINKSPQLQSSKENVSNVQDLGMDLSPSYKGDKCSDKQANSNLYRDIEKLGSIEPLVDEKAS